MNQDPSDFSAGSFPETAPITNGFGNFTPGYYSEPSYTQNHSPFPPPMFSTPNRTPNAHHYFMNSPSLPQQQYYSNSPQPLQHDFNIPNVKIDDMHNGLGEWRNIQSVIRVTFKSLCDTIIQQNYTIQNLTNRIIMLEKSLKDKVSRSDVALEVNKSVKDLQLQIEDKASTGDLIALLGKKANTEDVKNVLKTKADLEEMKAALEIKADSQDMSSVFDIHNREINELKKEIAKKVKLLDIEQISSTRLNVDDDMMAKKSDVKSLSDSIRDLKSGLDKRAIKDEIIDIIDTQFTDLKNMVDEIAHDCQQRPTSVAMKTLIDSSTQKAIKNVETQLEEVNNTIKNLERQTGALKSKVTQRIDEVIKSRVDPILAALDTKASIEEVNSVLLHKANVEEFNQLLNNKVEISDYEHSMNQIMEIRAVLEANETVSNRNSEEYNMIIKMLENKIDAEYFNGQLATKVDSSEMKELIEQKVSIKHVKCALNKKVNLSVFDSLKDEVLATVQSQGQVIEEIKEQLEKKATRESVVHALRKKISTEEFNTITEQFNKNIEELYQQVRTSTSVSSLSPAKTNHFLEEVRHTVDSVKQELSQKPNKKDILALLEKKVDIDDLTDRSTLRSNREQIALNTALLKLNTIGRWIWKSGSLKNGHGVPWNIQIINTNPENFTWSKDKVNIIVVQPGLYEICFGFYASKKPTVQLHVNGEPILSAMNAASYVVHHQDSPNKNNTGSSTVAHVRNHNISNSTAHSSITGLTLIDFIALPERCKIAISYIGDERSEGFLSLKKL